MFFFKYVGSRIKSGEEQKPVFFNKQNRFLDLLLYLYQCHNSLQCFVCVELMLIKAKGIHVHLYYYGLININVRKKWQADSVGGKIFSNTCILVVVGF